MLSHTVQLQPVKVLSTSGYMALLVPVLSLQN